ncbi:hypothetical protein [Parasphingopyxis sp.]|uniref:hypothetical protein n=1 Tax=Parasphingopyxis sp. TaxID=1920299 RepID=UPI003F9F9380
MSLIAYWSGSRNAFDQATVVATVGSIFVLFFGTLIGSPTFRVLNQNGRGGLAAVAGAGFVFGAGLLTILTIFSASSADFLPSFLSIVFIGSVGAVFGLVLAAVMRWKTTTDRTM